METFYGKVVDFKPRTLLEKDSTTETHLRYLKKCFYYHCAIKSDLDEKGEFEKFICGVKFNHFLVNVSISCNLKTTRKPTIFWCFQGVQNRNIVCKWIKIIHSGKMWLHFTWLHLHDYIYMITSTSRIFIFHSFLRWNWSFTFHIFLSIIVFSLSNKIL